MLRNHRNLDVLTSRASRGVDSGDHIPHEYRDAESALVGGQLPAAPPSTEQSSLEDRASCSPGLEPANRLYAQKIQMQNGPT